MGLISRWRAGRSVVRAASETIEIGQPPTPPAGNIAPSLAWQLEWGSEDPVLWMLGIHGCLSRRAAMMVPAVRKGVGIIADAIASMPLERWRGLERLDPGPLLVQPETDRPYLSTLTLTLQDLVLYPYAWWQVIARDAQRFPAKVRRLDPELISWTRQFETGDPEHVTATYQGRVIPTADLIRFDGPDEGLLALGVVEIVTALKLELSAGVYADPEIPSGYLKSTSQYPLDPDERVALLAEWRAGRRRGSTAFLQNVDYQNVMAMPDQLQLVQGREESAAQLARLLKLPPRYLGVKSGDSMTYSNVASERRDLLDLALNPYMGAIEQRLSMWDRNGTPRGQTVRFNSRQLSRSDAREMAEIGEILIRSGQSTVNEQRAERGLPPLPAAPAPRKPAADETNETEENP